MFSDHGPRYSSERKSVKGLLHERNPFFSFYLPDLFKQRYPDAVINLEDNLNTVIAPMDVHATLVDFIDLELYGVGGDPKSKNSQVKNNDHLNLVLLGLFII